MSEHHFFLHHHPKQEILADILLAKTRQESGGNPFHQPHILVRNQGMVTWLQRRIAKSKGICMQVSFSLPNDFLQNIIEAPSIDQENLKWQIYQTLPAFSKDSDFTLINKYLKHSEKNTATDKKRYQLSGIISGLFNKYLLYRPDWIASWKAGKTISNTRQHEAWQQKLWQKISKEDTSHWSEILLGNEPLPEPEKILTSLHVFGISNFAPIYIRFLYKLSQHIPVHIYWMNPVEKDGGYWEDAASKKEWVLAKEFDNPDVLENNNPLLSCFGRLGREFIHTLYGGDNAEETHLQEQYHDLKPAAITPATTKLQHLQSEIYNNTSKPNKNNNTQIENDDHSVSIHSCHSTIRELETLKTYLLTLAELSPLDTGDVLVMCPDIQAYAPAIESVFSKQHSPEIPSLAFSIGDCDQPNEDPTIVALLSLLKLHTSRFTNQDALSLLFTPAIRDQFELLENDQETISSWIVKNGIRWGMDDTHVAQINPNCPESPWTWKRGIERMLLGYAMPRPDRESQPPLWNGILPFHSIEGTNSRILNALCDFLQWCQSIRKKLNTPHHLDEWVQLTRQWLDQGTSIHDEHQRRLRPLYHALDTILLQAETMKEKIPADVFHEHLSEALRSATSGSGFLHGSITFCEMKPMRAIPSRVICLLGMNHDTFPRQNSEATFDLTRNNRRKGDRSIRDDDTYSFLEALLSAREHLFISYLGVSITDGKERPPSTVLQTLFDHIPSIRDCIIQEKLHNFDPAYFQKNIPIAHDPDLALSAEISLNSKKPNAAHCQISLPTEIAEKILPIDSLINTLTHPTRHFLKHSLQGHTTYLDKPLDPNEPISSDHLDKYHIKQYILNHQIITDEHIQAWKQESILPAANLYQLENLDGISKIAQNIPSVSPLKINCTVEDITLTGNVFITQDDNPVVIVTDPSRCKPKKILETWISLLAASIQLNRPLTAQLHGIEKNNTITKCFNPVDDPSFYLQELIRIYKRALTKPLPHFPHTSHAFTHASRAQKDDDNTYKNKQINAAKSQWEPNSNIPGKQESEDEANRYFFNTENLFKDNSFTDSFLDLTTSIWNPIKEHLETKK